MDLSPNYAGTLMGITNTMANIAGFVTPYVVGSIIEGNVRITGQWSCQIIFVNNLNSFQQTQAAWRTAFLLATGIYTVFNAIFVLLGSTEVQPWNTYWDMEKDARQPAQKTQNKK